MIKSRDAKTGNWLRDIRANRGRSPERDERKKKRKAEKEARRLGTATRKFPGSSVDSSHVPDEIGNQSFDVTQPIKENTWSPTGGQGFNLQNIAQGMRRGRFG